MVSSLVTASLQASHRSLRGWRSSSTIHLGKRAFECINLRRLLSLPLELVQWEKETRVGSY